jgi:hydroxymethylbilane synthase
VECREGDEGTIALIRPLNHPETAACVTAERALCRRLGGGCKVPVAAFATLHKEVLTLRGLVANRAGTRLLRVKHEGDVANAEGIGLRAAEELLQQGAEKILKEFE